jgi:hypothetical protein
MPPKTPTATVNLPKPFGKGTVDPPVERWVALWTITLEGQADPKKLYDTLITASKTLETMGGSCHLYRMTGLSRPYDFIGIAMPKDAKTTINKTDMLDLHQAVEASGTLKVTLLEGIEVGYIELSAYLESIGRNGRKTRKL